MIRMDSATVQPYEIRHQERLRSLAPECMVLLKQDGTFPIAPCRIAAYGCGVRHTIKGGTGSGDVNVRSFLNIEQALEQAGFQVVSGAWLDGYDQIRRTQEEEYRASQKASGNSALLGSTVPEMDYDLPMEKEAATALYVLARTSGEGEDRRDLPGDYRLTDTEIRDIRRAAAIYPRFMLILNTGAPVDLSPVLDVPNILLLSQLGSVTGEALTDVLTGRQAPSGRLTATWAELQDYPSTEGFGDPNDTVYQEGIYVGYRYFETFQKKPQFPFRFGLTYTSFSLHAENISVQNGAFQVEATVVNSGKWQGSDVLQLWYARVGEGLDCPSRELAAFARTSVLLPGEKEKVTLSFLISDLSAYDAQAGGNVLYGGTYRLLLGDGTGEVLPAADLVIDRDRILNQLTDLGGYPEEACLHAPACRREWPGSGKTIFISSASLTLPEDRPEERSLSRADQEMLAAMTDQQLAAMCLGDYKDGATLLEIIGNASTVVAGAAGQTCGRFQDLGIRPIIMADGPAGLRLSKRYQLRDGEAVSLESSLALEGQSSQKDQLAEDEPVYYQYCTAIPIGTAIAQSWDVNLARSCGEIVGEEMERFGIDIWLAPALNIQRNPLCGRNFEYYSEDPLLSGTIAAAVVTGVEQKPGRMTTIKHLACNNQETNRYFSNSLVSSRAMREIYLKGFELCIRSAHPSALMTSYNLLNGEHACNRQDLLLEVLRDEWGYEGLVMTDWLVTGGAGARGEKHPCASAAGCIKARNDLVMPGMTSDMEDLMAALNNPDHPYPLTREDLTVCAADILKTLRLLDQVRPGENE